MLLSCDNRVKVLFKYRPPDPHTIDLLLNQILHFSVPTELNDPFDCLVDIYFKGSKQDWEKWLSDAPFPDLNKQILKSRIEAVEYDGEQIVKRALRKSDIFYIYCLSKIPNNILMWSHYAKAHTGICIGFHTETQDNSLGIMLNGVDFLAKFPNVVPGYSPVFDVTYSSNRPEALNRLVDDKNKISIFLTTKSDSWKYEQEKRIIFLREFIKDQNIRFLKKSLSCVIFGLNTPVDYEKDVHAIIKKVYIDQGYPVKVYKCDYSKNKYEVILKKITIQ